MSSLLLCVTLAAPSTALAEAPPTAVQMDSEVASVVSAVQHRYADVNVIRAEFVQVSRLLGEVEEQRGTVVLQRPRKMRWSFTSSGQQFVTDGDTMWIYNPEQKQVMRFKDFGGQSSAADQLLQSLGKVGELFDVKMLEAKSGYKLSLTPRDDSLKGKVKALTLGLDSEYTLTSLVITDAFDYVTDLTFSNVKLGGDVDAGTFRFDIPAGVEVIDSNAG